MKKLIFAALAVVCLSVLGHAQPRPIDKGTGPTVKAAPAKFEAKYEGGMFGYNSKISGSLKFDDENSRLVFLNKEGKEMFGIPYDAVLVVYPNSRSVTSTTGSVISHIPLPGAGLAGFIKAKRRYMIIQFDDPDIDVKGAANFKINDKDLLDSAIRSLGEKAELTQRGDTYYRPRSGSGRGI